MDPVVTVKQGSLLGKECITSDGVKYYSFSKIPYAEPPVGKLRFKDPVAASGWNGIRDAIEESESCCQSDPFVGTGCRGSDDCLYLNVYTPKLESDKQLPVMVFIHGGGFVVGSGSKDTFGPDYLIARDVVVVNINYRLGVLGFLCTDSVNARGDMGLKDQSMALKWVKDNIREFNGDAENITLFGVSAGGASVECHLLSKMSRNLFHKAIIQSGSVMNPWARTLNGVNHTKKLAKKLGYNSDSSEGLFSFINGFETEKLVDAAKSLLDDNDKKMGNIFSFTPVFNEFDDYKGFIEGEPAKLLKEGDFYKVPTLSGVCSHEGIMLDMFYKEEVKQAIERREYIEFIPTYLNNSQNLKDKITNTYNGDSMGFTSDLNLTAGVLYSTEQRLKHNHSNEYLYQFSYDGSLSILKTMLGIDRPGASHADDTCYLGTINIVDASKATEEDIAMRNSMVTMWTDFAKTGNPTPESKIWVPVSENNFCYLDIGNEIVMKNELNPERRKLWRDMYDNMPQLRLRSCL